MSALHTLDDYYLIKMAKPVKKILIVGGGTSGWLTAGIIAAHHSKQAGAELEVVLVESSDIPPIGVGEGTWPTMKNTVQQIGIKEETLFRRCNAAFKQGGKFVEWVHGDKDFYYHPFTLPMGYGRLDLAPYVGDVTRFAEHSNFQHTVCEAGLAPRSPGEPEYSGPCNYAYHLDAGAFGQLLKEHCKEVLGVRQIIGTVSELVSDGSTSIDHIVLEDGQQLSADLFVDCTGFASLLLGKTLKVPFLDKSDVLFNDAALATQIPYEDADQALASHTIATAQNAGWIWDIGLSHRRGVGHVYASKYLSDDEAEHNLRQYIGPAADDAMIRKIEFQSGHRERYWVGNCVAVGLSAGFVEPLEATAIMLVEISARYIAENLPPDESVMPIVAKRFNEQMSYRWQRIIDFLKLHYMLSQRTEPYWAAHRDEHTFPQSLKDDLAIWSHRGPSKADFESAIELFPAASYQYVMYGMGFKPEFAKQQYLYQDQALAEKLMQRNSQMTDQMLQTLPPHRDYIEHWLSH